MYWVNVEQRPVDGAACWWETNMDMSERTGSDSEGKLNEPVSLRRKPKPI